MNAADGLDRQRADVIDVTSHQPFEAVADAEDIDPFESCPNRCRRDDTVDAGSRTAADEDRKTLMMFHNR